MVQDTLILCPPQFVTFGTYFGVCLCSPCPYTRSTILRSFVVSISWRSEIDYRLHLSHFNLGQYWIWNEPAKAPPADPLRSTGYSGTRRVAGRRSAQKQRVFVWYIRRLCACDGEEGRNPLKAPEMWRRFLSPPAVSLSLLDRCRRESKPLRDCGAAATRFSLHDRKFDWRETMLRSAPGFSCNAVDWDTDQLRNSCDSLGLTSPAEGLFCLLLIPHPDFIVWIHAAQNGLPRTVLLTAGSYW